METDNQMMNGILEDMSISSGKNIGEMKTDNNGDCKKGQSEGSEYPSRHPGTTSTAFITANVGSVFEDPDRLMPIWINQFDQFLALHHPEFVALHCQEVEINSLFDTSSKIEITLHANDKVLSFMIR